MEDFIREEGSTLIIFGCEQFAIKTSDAIFTAISDKLQKGNFKKIVFDFTETHYVSSAGLRHFSALLQECDETDIDLEIINVSDDVKTIFEINVCFVTFL